MRLLVVVLVLAAAGCAPSGGTPDPLTVFAASSLTETFTELGKGYQRRHGVTVRFSFGSSATLARQIAQGAPAQVFAAANPDTMRTVTGAGLAADDPVVFARNRLELAVPAGNPGGVRTLADLADPALRVALCARQVPCGAAAATVLAAAGVKVEPDTYAKDVKAALTQVRLGEVDAALVYHTDVIAAGDAVTGIAVPEAAKAVNDYPVAVLDGAPDSARDFVAYVRSGAGRTVLAGAGFELP
ncbi:MAG: molybdate ABC transporter substrate-binding protein [Micromonosporaceae bacterium]